MLLSCRKFRPCPVGNSFRDEQNRANLPTTSSISSAKIKTLPHQTHYRRSTPHRQLCATGALPPLMSFSLSLSPISTMSPSPLFFFLLFFSPFPFFIFFFYCWSTQKIPATATAGSPCYCCCRRETTADGKFFAAFF